MIYSARASSNQALKIFWYDRWGRGAQTSWILTFFPSKQKVYYTFQDGPVYLVYPVHFFPLCFCAPFPDTQLSSTSSPTNLLRSLSRFKSKSKSNRHLSSNASSHSFSPNQNHHHECLPQDSESSCVHLPQQTQLKIAEDLKLKFKDFRVDNCALNTNLRSPDPNQYLIQVFCRISAFLIDVGERCYPHIVHYSLFCFLSS